MEAVINYAFSNDTCRSQLLLAYFGDSNTDCGICDVCLSKKRDKNLNSKQFKKIQNDIITLLQNKPLEPSELIIKLASRHKEKNIRIMVQWLLDENIIKLNELNKIKIT